MKSYGRFGLSMFWLGYLVGLFSGLVYLKHKEHDFIEQCNIIKAELSTTSLQTTTLFPLGTAKDLEEELKAVPGNGSEELVYYTAEDLEHTVKVLCFVLTNPKAHKTKAIHIKKTWGKRCTILVFVSTQPEPDLEPVMIVKNIKENRKFLWAKTRFAIEEIYNKYLDQADWFLKADDDTYVIMENLRSFLQPYDAEGEHYFGHTFNPSWLHGIKYMSGGAAYVLSKGTVKKLVENAFKSKNKTICASGIINEKVELAEDLELGRCISNLNITIGDSRDDGKRLRFFPFSPETFLNSKRLKSIKWWWTYTNYTVKDGLECCSNTAISFHYIDVTKMYLFEYLLYHLRPIGIDGSSFAYRNKTLTSNSTEINTIITNSTKLHLK